MQIDTNRIRKYLDQIIIESDSIKSILTQSNDEILKSTNLIRGLKYSIIVISEAMVQALQHILAKNYNFAISGYKEAFVKAKEYDIVSSQLIEKLQPFISFRNMLVHHYWRVEDKLFLNNIRDGLRDFNDFVKQISDKFLQETQK